MVIAVKLYATVEGVRVCLGIYSDASSSSVGWVAKVIFTRFSCRAASITLITDWCVASASAWMVIMGLSMSLAASRMASRMVYRREFTSAVSLTKKLPRASTAILIVSSVGSVCSALALGKVMFISDLRRNVVDNIKKINNIKKMSIIGMTLTSTSSGDFLGWKCIN